MEGNWIKRPSDGQAVVFIHGIFAQNAANWRHDNGAYWPDLVATEAGHRAPGVYVFKYHSNVFSGAYRLGNAVDALKEHLRLDGVLDCRDVVFVCHSMGGIVVRKFIVERAQDLIERRTSIGLFLIASPSLGSSYANWLNSLASLSGHSQADALRFGQSNAWLRDLDKEFQNLKESARISLRGKELAEDKFIALRGFWRKPVVEEYSASRYFGEPYKVPESDHFSIATVPDKDAIQHRMLMELVGQPPSTVQKTAVFHPSGASRKLHVQAFDEMLRDLGHYLFQGELQHEFVSKGWDSPEEIEQLIDDYNAAITTVRRNEFVYESLVNEHCNAGQATAFGALIQAVKSVDEAVHALNDDVDIPSKLLVLESRLADLRNHFAAWRSAG